MSIMGRCVCGCARGRACVQAGGRSWVRVLCERASVIESRMWVYTA